MEELRKLSHCELEELTEQEYESLLSLFSEQQLHRFTLVQLFGALDNREDAREEAAREGLPFHNGELDFKELDLQQTLFWRDCDWFI